MLGNIVIWGNFYSWRNSP